MRATDGGGEEWGSAVIGTDRKEERKEGNNFYITGGRILHLFPLGSHLCLHAW